MYSVFDNHSGWMLWSVLGKSCKQFLSLSLESLMAFVSPVVFEISWLQWLLKKTAFSDSNLYFPDLGTFSLHDSSPNHTSYVVLFTKFPSMYGTLFFQLLKLKICFVFSCKLVCCGWQMKSVLFREGLNLLNDQNYLCVAKEIVLLLLYFSKMYLFDMVSL